MPDAYTVSVLPVRKRGAESNRRSRMPTWWQAVTPTSSIPMRIASSDAAGTPLRNTSDTPQEVQVIVEELSRGLGRESVGELERADAGVDPIRCQDLGRDGRVVTLRRRAVAHGCVCVSPSCPGISVELLRGTIQSAATAPHHSIRVIEARRTATDAGQR
jgi:hypothetical protein